jgi:hypothetical protein
MYQILGGIDMSLYSNISAATLTAMAATLLPAAALAATPAAMLEKSMSYAIGNEVKAFRVPTRDSAGKIKYYDVTVELTVNNDGTLNPLADVTASPSPNIPTGAIPPGTYKAPGGETCSVTNMTLTNGRIQSFFTCDRASHSWEMSVATGGITAGHPYLAQLKASGIDKLPDASTYTWGTITNDSFLVGSCGYYNESWRVGAKTNGSKLILSIFGSNASFQCSATFTKN